MRVYFLWPLRDIIAAPIKATNKPVTEIIAKRGAYSYKICFTADKLSSVGLINAIINANIEITKISCLIIVDSLIVIEVIRIKLPKAIKVLIIKKEK